MSKNDLPSKSQTEAKLSNVSDYSHLQFAQLYHKMNKTRYIYSTKTGWYSYNDFNILENHKGEPVSLLNDVVIYLTDYIKDEMMHLPPTVEDYKKVHNELFKAFNRISTSSFSKGIISLLPMLYLDKDIDEKIDARKDLFSFKISSLTTSKYTTSVSSGGVEYLYFFI